MNKGFSWIMKKGALFLGLSATCLFSMGELVSAEKKLEAEPTMNWKEFHSVSGKCRMKFPDLPQHVTESLNVSEDGYNLRYDAYISAVDKQTVFMLLVAQYPDFVDETYARMSLEGFLNGVLNHNPGNQLIFADLLLVDGHEALDFLIRTGSVYFKGRALMVKNSLYLMAMECEMQKYNDSQYVSFVNSFKLAAK